MAKVTMETVKHLQEVHRASEYLPVVYKGREYMQIMDMDTVSGTSESPYWENIAVRLGDEIDEEGYAPTYSLIWFLDNPDAEDAPTPLTIGLVWMRLMKLAK